MKTVNLARSMALGALSLLGILGLAPESEPTAVQAEALVVCTQPVEYFWPATERSLLGCQPDSQHLRAELQTWCGKSAAGIELDAADRVVITATSPGSECTLVKGGMSAKLRLLQGFPLELNRVTAAELTLLPKLGQKRADLIWQRGQALPQGFTDLRQLLSVPGIGPGTFKRLAPYLSVKLPRIEH